MACKLTKAEADRDDVEVRRLVVRRAALGRSIGYQQQRLRDVAQRLSELLGDPDAESSQEIST